MIKDTIYLKTLEDVKSFVSLAMERNYDIELLSGKYIVNAKSIMGVFSLDLTKPIMVVANTDSDAALTESLVAFQQAPEEQA